MRFPDQESVFPDQEVRLSDREAGFPDREAGFPDREVRFRGCPEFCVSAGFDQASAKFRSALEIHTLGADLSC